MDWQWVVVAVGLALGSGSCTRENPLFSDETGGSTSSRPPGVTRGNSQEPGGGPGGAPTDDGATQSGGGSSLSSSGNLTLDPDTTFTTGDPSTGLPPGTTGDSTTDPANSGTTGAGPVLSCCVPSGTVDGGCDDFELLSCLCDIEGHPELAYCCDPGFYDQQCIVAAIGLCEHTCTSHPFSGPCCDMFPAPGQLGCDDPGVMACVCEESSECCAGEWLGCAEAAFECGCLPAG